MTNSRILNQGGDGGKQRQKKLQENWYLSPQNIHNALYPH